MARKSEERCEPLELVCLDTLPLILLGRLGFDEDRMVDLEDQHP